jgi:hypothetical protein
MQIPNEIHALNIRCKAGEQRAEELAKALVQANRAYLALAARLDLAERHLSNILTALYGPPPGAAVQPEDVPVREEAPKILDSDGRSPMSPLRAVRDQEPAIPAPPV